MSRIKSSEGRDKTSSSFRLSNKSLSHIIRSEKTNKFNQEIFLIDNFTNENQEQLNIEQALTNFYDYALDSYKKKLYDNLIKEIEMNKNLLYNRNIESFKIVIIKIKCLMKLMIEKYENDLNDINDEQMSLKEYVNAIQKEFWKLNTIIKVDDNYEYETLTQIYCKFLIYLIKFIQKKEEYFKSLAYITLGINMVKIFFIRKKVTKDIKLYKRYIYLLILLINHLIGEGDFTHALLYAENILKIIETVAKILSNKDNNYNSNKKMKYLMELIRCSGFVHIYIGFCHDLRKKQESAMDGYKQAFYFFMKLKSPKFHGIKLNEEKIFHDNILVQISHWFLNKIRAKLADDKKRKKIRMSMLLEGILDKKNENDEKRKKLNLISSGLNDNQRRYNIIENKLYTNVLNSKNNKIIEKLDKLLITLAYQEKKKPMQLTQRNRISYNIMETMCHYQIYNKLMTEKYQEFVMNNNNIKLSNPKDEEDFIHKINSYLTQNMEIKPQTSRKNKSIKIKPEQNNKNKILNKNSFSSNNLFNKKVFTSVNLSANIDKNKDIFLKKINSETLSDKNILYDNKNSKKLPLNKRADFSSLKLDLPNFSNNLFKNKMTKSFSDTYITSKTFNSKGIKPKQKQNLKREQNMLWSKNIYLNPKYFKRYMKLDKLIKKELDFQKDILNLKSSNSKLYHNSFAKEIFISGKDKEEERNQDYMILTEKIDQKVLNNQKEYEKLIYFNIKKKKGNNKLKNKSINDFLDDEILGINKKLNLEGSEDEEEKNFNEINKNKLLTVNEKLKNIIFKMRERKKLLRKMKHEKK